MAGCSDDDLDIDVESSIPVRVETITYQPMKEYVFATGSVQAINDALLKAQQSGYYTLQQNPRTGAPFAMADRARMGEVIAILHNPEFENQVAYDSKKLNNEVSKREFEKQKTLYDKGGITLRELTDAERAAIDARYGFDNAVLQLQKLLITSPFDGVIVDLPYFSKGQLVEAGTVVTHVMDYSRLHSQITLPGKEMGRIKRGQTAFVTNYNHEADTLIGLVTQVSPTLDPESRMFKVSLSIANDSLIFRPGMFVKIDLVVKEKDSALVIPKEVVLDRRGNKTVFVVQKGIAVERKLDIGLENRYQIEVLSGLAVDERLVVEGFETLRHRSNVKVSK